MEAILQFFDSIDYATFWEYAKVYGSYALELLTSDVFFLCVLGIVFWCFSKKVAYKIGLSYIAGTAVCGIIRSAVHTISPSGGLFTFAALGTGHIINFRKIALKILAVILIVVISVSVFFRDGRDPWSVLISLAVAIILNILANAYIDGTVFDSRQNFLYLLVLLIPSAVYVITIVALYANGICSTAYLEKAGGQCGITAGLAIATFIERQFVNFIPKCMRSSQTFLKGLFGLIIILATYFLLDFVFGLIGETWALTFAKNFATVLAGFGFYPFLIRQFFSPSFK